MSIITLHFLALIKVAPYNFLGTEWKRHISDQKVLYIDIFMEE
jgi:hypothetical protein